MDITVLFHTELIIRTQALTVQVGIRQTCMHVHTLIGTDCLEALINADSPQISAMNSE